MILKMHQRGWMKSNHVCCYEQPTLCTLCIVHSSANGRSPSCIFEMPSGQVVIGSVQDGGGTQLTRGSSLLIEWWKTDREWEGMTDTDGWIDKWLEQKNTTSLQKHTPQKGFSPLWCATPLIWSLLEKNPLFLIAFSILFTTLAMHHGSTCAYARTISVSYGTPKHHWRL